MIKMATRFFCIVTTFLFLMVACSNNLESDIVGRWQEVDDSEVIEFYKDGTVTIEGANGNFTGDYRFVDDTHIRLDVPTLFGTTALVAEVNMSGDNLTLSYNGQKSEYKRAEGGSAPAATKVSLLTTPTRLIASTATRPAPTATLAPTPTPEPLSNTILSKGELVLFMTCSDLGFAIPKAFALQPNDQWLTIPVLSNMVPIERANNPGDVAGRARISYDKEKIAWAQTDFMHNLGIIEADGLNNRILIQGDNDPAPIGPRSINWSPDSQRLVVVTREGRGFENAVIVLDMISGGSETIWKGIASDALFMPDNQRLLLSYSPSEGGPGILSIYDPITGQESRVSDFPNAPQDMAWNPDRTKIAFTLEDGIWVINVDGSNPIHLVDDPLTHNPKWSPDGSLLLYHLYQKDSEWAGDIQLIQADRTLIPGNLTVPSCIFRDSWWTEGNTPAVKAQFELVEEGRKERTVQVDFTEQLYGLKLTIGEFEVTNDRVRVYLTIENTGEYGRVFIQPSEITLYALNQTDATGGPIHIPNVLSTLGRPRYENEPLSLKVESDLPSVLPTGMAWDGWLTTEKPVPPDVIGAVIVFKSFEFEQPYDQSGGRKVDWDSTQENQDTWYQHLR